jgi:uncharacterized protein DUF87
MRQLEAANLRQVGAEDAGEVAIKAGGVEHGAVELLFALGPQAIHGTAFGIEVFLHRRERFDDALDAMLKLRADQVLIKMLGLGLLALQRSPHARNLEHSHAQRSAEANCKFAFRHPYAVDDAERRDAAILGTTGGGKSTTVARFVQQAQAANLAVIVLDVEGEYTRLHEPTTNADMLAALKERGLRPTGLPQGAMTLYHLVGRETANPDHPSVQTFSPQFAHLSPYTAAEILGLTEPQHQRFMQAYDIAKEIMRERGIFPAHKNEVQERMAMEIDEFERGYPRLTITMMIDVVKACCHIVGSAKEEKGEGRPELVLRAPQFASAETKDALNRRIHAAGKLDNPVSWRTLLGRLNRLDRLRVFDSSSSGAGPLKYKDMLKPGAVSVIDLSDSGMSELTNIVISDLLRGVQEAQDEAYQEHEKAKRTNPQTRRRPEP